MLLFLFFGISIFSLSPPNQLIQLSQSDLFDFGKNPSPISSLEFKELNHIQQKLNRVGIDKLPTHIKDLNCMNMTKTLLSIINQTEYSQTSIQLVQRFIFIVLKLFDEFNDYDFKLILKNQNELISEDWFKVLLIDFYTPLYHRYIAPFSVKDSDYEQHPLNLYIKYLINTKDQHKLEELSIENLLPFFSKVQNFQEAIIHFFDFQRESTNRNFQFYKVKEELRDFIFKNKSELYYPPLKIQELDDLRFYLKKLKKFDKVNTLKRIDLFLFHLKERVVLLGEDISDFTADLLTLSIQFTLGFTFNFDNQTEKKLFYDIIKDISFILTSFCSINKDNLIAPTTYINKLNLRSFNYQLIDFFIYIYIPLYDFIYTSEPFDIGLYSSPFELRFSGHPLVSFLNVMMHPTLNLSDNQLIEYFNLLLEKYPFSDQTSHILYFLSSSHNIKKIPQSLKDLFCFYAKKNHAQFDCYEQSIQNSCLEELWTLKQYFKNQLKLPNSSYVWLKNERSSRFKKENTITCLLYRYLLASQTIEFPAYPQIPSLLSQKIISQEEFESYLKTTFQQKPLIRSEGRTDIYFLENCEDIICVKVKKKEEDEIIFFQELDTMEIVQQEAQKLGIPYSQHPLGKYFPDPTTSALVYKAKKASFEYINEMTDDDKMIQSTLRGLKLYANLGYHRQLYYNETCGLSHHGEARRWSILISLIGSRDPGTVESSAFKYPNMTRESVRDTADLFRPLKEGVTEQSAYSCLDKTLPFFSFSTLRIEPLIYCNTPLHQAFSAFLMYVNKNSCFFRIQDTQNIQKHVDLFCQFFAISLSAFYNQDEQKMLHLIQTQYGEMIYLGIQQLFYFFDPAGLKKDICEHNTSDESQFKFFHGHPLEPVSISIIVLNQPTYLSTLTQDIGLANSSFPAPSLIEAYLYLLGESLILAQELKPSLEIPVAFLNQKRPLEHTFSLSQKTLQCS